MASQPKIIFINDTEPGFSRRRRGKGWSYHRPDGTLISEQAIVMRLNGLAMPPAYRNCWFSPVENSHLQATGYDARKRKQYRYHPDYRAARDSAKFERLPQFGEALTAMRERVASDLRMRSTCKDRALAAIVRLLDDGLVRIGNDCYAEANGSYGATTLEMAHMELSTRRLHLEFRAKSGKERSLKVDDRGLLRFVRDMQDLPGQRLFKYMDDDGEPHLVHSHDVNDYIRAEMGEAFTAKDFRTFGASTIAYGELLNADEKLSIKALTEIVATSLGNTPAIARKSYIHPKLIDLASREPEELKVLLPLPRKTKWLSRYERGLVAYFS